MIPFQKYHELKWTYENIRANGIHGRHAVDVTRETKINSIGQINQHGGYDITFFRLFMMFAKHGKNYLTIRLNQNKAVMIDIHEPWTLQINFYGVS